MQALSIFSGYLDGENSLDQLHFHVTENEVLRRTSTRIQTLDSALSKTYKVSHQAKAATMRLT